MNHDIVIVSLGSGDPDLLNSRTLETLRSTQCLILRTSRHPFSLWLENNHISYSSCDDLYESSEDFDDLDRRIASFLLQQADVCSLVYAVTDATMDRSVRTLVRMSSGPASVSIIPGIGISSLHLSHALPYLDDSGVTVIPAYDFADTGFYDPNQSVLITELDNPLLAGQIKIRLSVALDDEYRIVLLNDQDAPVLIPLYELDRYHHIDHRTAVLVPSSGYMNRNHFVMNDLISIMEKLRSPEGCPWDKQQTHKSLQPYLVEEAWECVAAIDQDDMDHLCEELGDLLFQIVFHSSVAQSFDEFSLNDVLTSVCGKMIRRHPHVFSGLSIQDADSVAVSWEKIKQKETGHLKITDSLEDVSSGLPSLKYAAKSLKKLCQSDQFSRPSLQILSDIRQIADHFAAEPDHIAETDIGRFLLLCSELCCSLHVDGELVLHQAVDSLKNKLRQVESRLHNDGKSLEHLTFSELGVYLQCVEGEIE